MFRSHRQSLQWQARNRLVNISTTQSISINTVWFNNFIYHLTNFKGNYSNDCKTYVNSSGGDLFSLSKGVVSLLFCSLPSFPPHLLPLRWSHSVIPTKKSGERCELPLPSGFLGARTPRDRLWSTAIILKQTSCLWETVKCKHQLSKY